MDLRYPPALERFRLEVRAWVEAALPAWWSIGQPEAHEEWGEFARNWSAMLHRTGWATPTWPPRYGGLGLTTIQAALAAEEFARVNAPVQANAAGEMLVGPALFRWGTPQQKHRFLLPIARGGAVWCQGFSEPDAGSDLGALATTGHRHGREIVLSGRKAWISHADAADLMMTLVRTEPAAPAHRGISCLLVPMRQPGVTVVPISQPDGAAGFADVLLDGAHCPLDNVLGPLGGGWKVAMATLTGERAANLSSAWYRYDHELRAIIEAALRQHRLHEPVLRQRIAKAWSMVQVSRYQGLRVMASLAHPEHASPTVAADTGASVLAAAKQELAGLAMDAMGVQSTILHGTGRPTLAVGFGDRPVLHSYPADATQGAFVLATAASILGGTAQIQRNIIAERILGLPRG